jgi:hypothetical protein
LLSGDISFSFLFILLQAKQDLRPMSFLLDFLLLAVCVVQAQGGGSTIASIETAGIAVKSRHTAAGVDLFDSETFQLTKEVLATLASSDKPEVASLFADSNNQQRVPSRSCKSAPGDSLWPSKQGWDTFNSLLGGTLSPILPIASPCYSNSTYNNYNASECAAVTIGFSTESLHFSNPGSVMWPIYEGKTCMPGTNASILGACTQGGYSSYSINVSNVAQIQLAVIFASTANLRLVVKNTGHDYNGRSTGKDALSLWTHNLKEIRFLKEFIGHNYTGSAFKVGAGVQVIELYRAAEVNHVTVVGGICPTVGIAGGYITGGGHSPLMQLFGMGADQVLALEVVTASGEFITVTPTVNSDLYWAMLGGGGGTFGIITSALIKAHSKIPVTTSTFSFGPLPSEDLFWKGFTALWESFPAWNAAKTYSYFGLSNITGNLTFNMNPFFAPNMSVAEYEKLIAPFLTNLTKLGIPYALDISYHPTFLSAFDATFTPQDQHIGGSTNIPGNRIIPATNWDNSTIRGNTITAIKKAVSNSLMLAAYHQAPYNPTTIINSVNPAFRNEASMIVAVGMSTSSDDQLGAASKALTNNILGPLREVSPGGGTYGNEAEINEPNWQQAFWGTNYPRLLETKKKWDPYGLFYVHHGVGSEEWEVRGGSKFGGVPTQDGRLCKI